MEIRDEVEELPSSERFVEIRTFRDVADDALDVIGLRNDIEAAYARCSARGPEQGG